LFSYISPFFIIRKEEIYILYPNRKYKKNYLYREEINERADNEEIRKIQFTGKSTYIVSLAL
jgi:hypothetical protein